VLDYENNGKRGGYLLEPQGGVKLESLLDGYISNESDTLEYVEMIIFHRILGFP